MTTPTPPTDYIHHQGEALALLHDTKTPTTDAERVRLANTHAALVLAAAVHAWHEDWNRPADVELADTQPLAEWERELLAHQTRRLTASEALVALSEWIDAANAHKPPEQQAWERTAKVAEECGEVIAAMIGMTGQNPRKGVTHTVDDVVAELLDVAITALGGVEHLTGHKGGALELLDRKILSVARRAGIPGPTTGATS